MIEARPGKGRLTVGADKGYDTKDFVDGLRWVNVSPHVAQNDTHRRSAIDRRTTPSHWLCSEPAGAQADQGSLRLGQDHRRVA